MCGWVNIGIQIDVTSCGSLPLNDQSGFSCNRVSDAGSTLSNGLFFLMTSTKATPTGLRTRPKSAIESAKVISVLPEMIHYCGNPPSPLSLIGCRSAPSSSTGIPSPIRIPMTQLTLNLPSCPCQQSVCMCCSYAAISHLQHARFHYFMYMHMCFVLSEPLIVASY